MNISSMVKQCSPSERNLTRAARSPHQHTIHCRAPLQFIVTATKNTRLVNLWLPILQYHKWAHQAPWCRKDIMLLHCTWLYLASSSLLQGAPVLICKISNPRHNVGKAQESLASYQVSFGLSSHDRCGMSLPLSSTWKPTMMLHARLGASQMDWLYQLTSFYRNYRWHTAYRLYNLQFGCLICWHLGLLIWKNFIILTAWSNFGNLNREFSISPAADDVLTVTFISYPLRTHNVAYKINVLYLAAGKSDSKISNKGILCLTTVAADHHPPPSCFWIQCCLDRLCHGTNLIHLPTQMLKSTYRAMWFPHLCYYYDRASPLVSVWRTAPVKDLVAGNKGLPSAGEHCMPLPWLLP